MRHHQTSFLAYIIIIMLVNLSCSSENSTIGDGNGNTEDTQVAIENLSRDLHHPWGMTFLPDGRLLVTEREGSLRILDQSNNLSEPLNGVPEVFDEGQGGLLDVALDPDYANNGYIYLSFSEPGENNTASTAVGRGTLEGNSIQNFTVLFSQEPKVEGPNHFGGRIVFSPDGYLFLTMGERFTFDPAQDITNHLGSIVRLNKDGSIPADNPFVKESNAKKEIWSYGHRNIEAAAFHPETGKLWIAEMGPQGGDELNQPEAGNNHGWPVVSWGEHYDGKDIPDPSTHPEFADAKAHWTPVISPSGMTFYNGTLFPELNGNMLIGGLSAKAIVRVQITGAEAKEIGRIDLGARIRDVEQAPDGSIYILIDRNNGNIWRLVPKTTE